MLLVWNVWHIVAVILVQFGSDWSNIERDTAFCFNGYFLKNIFYTIILGGLACAQGCRELWVLIYI
jgi:hypothetical protein